MGLSVSSNITRIFAIPTTATNRAATGSVAAIPTFAVAYVENDEVVLDPAESFGNLEERARNVLLPAGYGAAELVVGPL